MCKCNDAVKPKRASASGFSTALQALAAPDEPMVRIQYQGGGGAKVSVYGKTTGQFYGRRLKGETFMVLESDQKAQPGLFEVI